MKTLMSNLLPLIVAAIVGGATGFFVSNRQQNQGDWPIAIIDSSSIIKNFVETAPAGTPDPISGGIREAQGLAERLSAAGYVVIDQQYIMAAPSEYFAGGAFTSQGGGENGQEK